MSYNYHNQAPNYNRTPQQPQQVHQQNYPTSNHPQNQQGRQDHSDPFFNFGENAFNMDIREDFEDPFENMGNRMGGFGFPNVANLEQQMLGRFQNEMQQMHQLGQGMDDMNNNQGNNNNQMQLRNNGPSGQQGMFMHMGSMGGPGTMISKTYVSKVDYSSGQPHEESYQSQAIKQFGEGGHNISERQEAYKNSYTGVQKAAHQRLLDDRGTKLIKQRNVNTGEQSQHNILKGLQENEVDSFNQQYNDYREKVHFQDNYKYLNSLNPGKMMKQLGKGKEGQNNLMLGDGNEFGNYDHNNNYGNNQYQNQNQQQGHQGQQGQYQYNNQQMYPNQGQHGNNYQYQNQNNNYRKGY